MPKCEGREQSRPSLFAARTAVQVRYAFSMKQATLKEVSERLDELVEEARCGETIVIVENGAELARLTPPANGRAATKTESGAGDIEWDAKLSDLERRGLIKRSKISDEKRATIV